MKPRDAGVVAGERVFAEGYRLKSVLLYSGVHWLCSFHMDLMPC